MREIGDFEFQVSRGDAYYQFYKNAPSVQELLSELTKEKKQKREKKVKSDRDKLEKEGLKRNKNQLVIRDWLKGGSMRLANQGESRGAKKQGKPKKGIG